MSGDMGNACIGSMAGGACDYWNKTCDFVAPANGTTGMLTGGMTTAGGTTAAGGTTSAGGTTAASGTTSGQSPVYPPPPPPTPATPPVTPGPPPAPKASDAAQLFSKVVVVAAALMALAIVA